MCMIGSRLYGTYSMTYKQCDLIKPTNFYEPIILNGIDGIKYLKFGRDGNTGSWCGVNNYGVSFVAADAYMDAEKEIYNACDVPSSSIFDAYCKIVSDFKDAKSATEFMREFYRSFTYPDILLISDAKNLFYIEAFNGEVIAVEKSHARDSLDNHFFSANHFRFIQGAVEYHQNKSTYLRLERAENLAMATNNVFHILSDQYYGKSVMSICRDKEIVPVGEDAYFTQASSVFATNGKQTNCAYLINGNPRISDYILITDVFGDCKRAEYSSFEDLLDKIARLN